MLITATNTLGKMAGSSKTVLLEFRGSKRVIAFQNAEDVIQLCQAQLQSLVCSEKVRLVTDVEHYHASQSDSEKAYLLQRYSTEWQEFVDVLDVIEIDNKDHLKAVPIPIMSPIKVHIFNINLKWYS